VPHGEANYQFFIEVFRYYENKKPHGKIQELKEIIASVIGCSQKDAFDELGNMLNKLLMLKPLREYGMKEAEVSGFAKNVIDTQQRLLKNNYVTFTEEDLVSIYSKLY
jgi:4-hydroxybutyrate dehydrogenase